MSYVLGIDIGGTFTDAFGTADDGTTTSVKVPSTPPDYREGVLSVIDELAQALETDSESLLGDTEYICHGTTAALNALVTGAVAKVGFLATRGHADSIRIMNLEGRYAGLDADEIQNMPHTQKPEPLVPARLVRELDERIDHKGAVIVEIDREGTRAAIRELLAEGVEAIAVSLLWSFRNPGHEQIVRELIREQAPDMYVGLSSELSPRIREYQRSVTTIMSTQVSPKLREYLAPLEETLRDRGFRGALLIMQGSGGSISAADAADHAITTIGSVLTGGVIGSVTLGEELKHPNIISTDMGGTTFLVGLVVDGKPVTSTTSTLKQHTLNLPMVRINTIGAGGGAIAWLDQGNNLRVGPRSAAADPGPACYDQGGTEPTVTDADLTLGILNPDFFLGGRKRLDPSLAAEAIRTHIAEPLGMTVEEAAAAIYAIQNSQTADLVRRSVVNAGHDPRDFVVYAFGGAAPVHCASYSAELGAQGILVPLGTTAAAFSAYGLASADAITSAELSDPSSFPLAPETVNEAFDTLERQVRAQLDDQGLTFASVSVRRELDIRYTMQLAEVSTPVALGRLDEAGIEQIGADFEALYERLYGVGSGFREAGLQAITYRVHAVGELAVRPHLPELDSGRGELSAPKEHRRVLLDTTVGWQDTPIYDYAVLRAGDKLEGPAVIEAPTTTVAVPPGTHGVVDRLGNIQISIMKEDSDADHPGAGFGEVRVQAAAGS